MSRYVAFLRAINVGGHVVKMERLRAEFVNLGLSAVETFIASGNIVFESRASAASLEPRIAAHLEAVFGWEVATFLRTVDEVAAVAAYAPFPPVRMGSAGALVVGFLREPLDAKARRVVEGFDTDIDEFHVKGREVYWLCRRKQSESSFSNVAFERALRVPATFRGISTVRKLADKYPPLSQGTRAKRSRAGAS